MKNFFKFLGIFAIIGIAMVSCSEDIWVHDGADGRDGIDGQDGQDAEYPVFTTEKDWISDLCWIRTILRDGYFFYSDTLCNGEKGDPGSSKEGGWNHADLGTEA